MPMLYRKMASNRTVLLSGLKHLRLGQTQSQRYISSGLVVSNKQSPESWDFLTGKTPPEKGSDTFAQTHEKEKQKEKDLHNSEYHVSRPFQDKSGTRLASTEKERQIFSKIFESILSQTDSSSNKANAAAGASSKNKKSKGLSGNIQALFQQAKDDSRSSGVNLEMLSRSAKNKPLISILDGSYQLDKNTTSLNDPDKEHVKSFMKYIDSLSTDQEVVDFYCTHVLDRYDSAAKNSSVGSSVDPATKDILQSMDLNSQRLPMYLLHCMKVLVENFREPVEALSLFELSKRKSIEFYSKSCSADVYNYVLLLRWNYYRDLYAVESLVSELLVNAVLGNKETLQVLDQIFRDIIDAKHGMLESNNIALWNQEDEERFKKLQIYKTRILALLNTHSSPSIFGGIQA